MKVRPHYQRSSSSRVHAAPAGQSWTVKWEESTPESLEQNTFLPLVTSGKLPRAPNSLGIAKDLGPGLQLLHGHSDV